ncbi:MAG: HGxxPAAW family protein [Terrimesophilobacter sp.]
MSNADISDPGHGNSPAAWVAVIVMIIGFIVGAVGFWFASLLMIWVAVGLVLGGWLLGWILAKVGYGVAGPRYVPKNSH